MDGYLDGGIISFVVLFMDINGAQTDQNIKECFHVNVKFVENKKYFNNYELVKDSKYDF